MAEHSPMGSLLAAVAVAAASSDTNPTNPPSSTPSLTLPLPHLPPNLPPISIPPPPPPLPPPLPSPPPLPPMSIRTPHSNSANHFPTIPTPPTEKRKGARIFAAHEKSILEANYTRNKFPSRLHMETLGNAMGKGTDKVRTWYNNRRALDRKLGVNVNRAQPCHPSPTTLTPSHPAPTVTDNPPTLPNHLLSSPDPRSHFSPQCSPRTPHLISSKTSVRSPHNNHFTDLTPSHPPWTPSMSPVTSARHSQVVISTSPYHSITRFRTSPLRIRNVRLRIGSKDICGEIPEHLALDNGLEVKFLFGKKRILYEWYCGSDYSDAHNTGGPYAKMEMNFASISAAELIQEPNHSVLVFSFSYFPTLFLQTRESMMKYRVRAQQRQYRKVSHTEFPIPVTAERHRILIRRDEASRVLRLLCEDIPEFLSTPLAEGERRQQWNISSHFNPKVSTLLEGRGLNSGIEAHHSTPASSSGLERRPFTAFDTSSKRSSAANVCVSEPRGAKAGGDISDAKHHNYAVLESSVPFRASRNTLGQQSRATLRNPKDNVWLTQQGAQGASKPTFIKPIVGPGLSHGSDGQVRRELNFNHISGQPESTPGVGGKRATPETGYDENAAKLKMRRKGTGLEASQGELPKSTPGKRLEGSNLPSEPNTRSENSLKDTKDKAFSHVASQGSILRVLPR